MQNVVIRHDAALALMHVCTDRRHLWETELALESTTFEQPGFINIKPPKSLKKGIY